MRALWALCLIALLYPWDAHAQLTPVTPEVPDSVYWKARGVMLRVDKWDYMENPLLLSNRENIYSPDSCNPSSFRYGAVCVDRQFILQSEELGTLSLFMGIYTHIWDTDYTRARGVKALGILIDNMKITLGDSSFAFKDAQALRVSEKNDGQCVYHDSSEEWPSEEHFISPYDVEVECIYPSPVWLHWSIEGPLFNEGDVVTYTIHGTPALSNVSGITGRLIVSRKLVDGKPLKGHITLSWRIPEGIGDAHSAENQRRGEKLHKVTYEYRALSDGDRIWKAIPDSLLEYGHIEQGLFGEQWQYRKATISGFDPEKAYTFCLRGVNPISTGSEICNLTPITPTSVQASELPGIVTLSQNYPNPFNPSTEIAYTLSVAASIRLEVFDMTGRIIQTPVNGLQPAGRHTVRFDAHELPTGTYAYRLTVGEETLTRMMTLFR